VLWQHELQVVVCVLGVMQRALVHTPQPETHAATTLHYL